MRSADDAGGRIEGAGGKPAFHLWRERSNALPVIVAIPHDGRVYPPDLIDRMRNPDYVLKRLEDRHVGMFAPFLLRNLDVSLLVADAPRALIDLNRSPDDIDWSMVAGSKRRSTSHSMVNRRARNGLGLIPRRIPGVGEIWRGPISQAELDDRLATIYQPYHAALARELERLRDAHGVALLIDLHSMPPLKEANPATPAAEFVIGDRFGVSSDDGLSDLAIRYLSAHGRRVAHNRPYSGGYMLDRHSNASRNIHAIQLEMCRSLYLDAHLDQPSARLPAIARLVAGLVGALGSAALELAPPQNQRHAAE